MMQLTRTKQISGRNRQDLGELSIGKKVSIVVNDDGCYPTLGSRITRIDKSGQRWVKFKGKYWRYPEQVER